MRIDRWPDAPDGFVRLENGSGALYVRETRAAEVVAAGLDEERGWTARIAVGGEPRGMVGGASSTA